MLSQDHEKYSASSVQKAFKIKVAFYSVSFSIS